MRPRNELRASANPLSPFDISGIPPLPGTDALAALSAKRFEPIEVPRVSNEGS
jgi:hypothetical protein